MAKLTLDDLAHIAAQHAAQAASRPASDVYRMDEQRWQETMATYIEQWPAALMALSIPSAHLPLSAREARVLGSHIVELGEGFDVADIPPDEAQAITDSIVSRLDELLQCFPGGAFVRLGSRSPKDAWMLSSCSADLKRGLVRTGSEALERLTACSERIYDDLQTALAMGYEPTIWLRQWLELEPWQEFRCFMKDRQLVGISQYDYHQGRQERIITQADAVIGAIRRFFTERFTASIHLDSVVFDVVVQESAGELAATLLEFNPYSGLTDPCLFDWRKLDMFNGQLLYCTETVQRLTTAELLALLDDEDGHLEGAGSGGA